MASFDLGDGIAEAVEANFPPRVQCFFLVLLAVSPNLLLVVVCPKQACLRATDVTAGGERVMGLPSPTLKEDPITRPSKIIINFCQNPITAQI